MEYDLTHCGPISCGKRCIAHEKAHKAIKLYQAPIRIQSVNAHPKYNYAVMARSRNEVVSGFTNQDYKLGINSDMP